MLIEDHLLIHHSLKGFHELQVVVQCYAICHMDSLSLSLYLVLP